MRVLENVDLSLYTTIRIGGIAECMYFPETVEDLEKIEINPNVLVLGGGSNVLINDKKVFDEVICLRNFQCFFRWYGDKLEVGSGISIHKLIEEINEHGYGGIEYLYTVPGLVGGAIAMNAGRGSDYNMSIADYLESVKVMQRGKIVTLSKEECGFSYRNSRFKNGNEIILSAVFTFDKVDGKMSNRKKKERVNYVKESQDMSYPNLGTTFCRANPFIMSIIRKIPLGRNGVCFSTKTSNWLQNRQPGGGEQFEGALFCIKTVEKLHKLFGKECQIEYVIWR